MGPYVVVGLTTGISLGQLRLLPASGFMPLAILPLHASRKGERRIEVWGRWWWWWLVVR